MYVRCALFCAGSFCNIFFFVMHSYNLSFELLETYRKIVLNYYYNY